MMKKILVCMTFTVTVAVGQWQSVGNVRSFSVTGNRIEFLTGKDIVQITVLAEDLIKVRATGAGTSENDHSVAVVKTNWPVPTFRVDSVGPDISIRTSHVNLLVKKNPFRLTFEDSAGNILNQDDKDGMAWNGDEVRVWKKKPEGEFYYGLGEKAGSFNRSSKTYTMWNSDIPAYKADTDPLYQSVPFFYGIKNGRAYGIFFDNTYWASFDFGKESGQRYSFGAQGGEINYYFFAGPTPAKILSRYTELVGRMPLPPRWSLGYQQCRWSYYPESRVRALASTFRRKKIPCDVIYLDIDYMEGYRIFTWSSKNFPDPKKMISDLAKDGFKIVVIVDPGIKVDSLYPAYQSGLSHDLFLKYPDGKPFIGTVWPGECVFPDFSNPAARIWWGNNFKVLADAGVRGFWNDMNEPSVFNGPDKTVALDVVHYDNGLYTSHAKNHNTYGMLMTQGTYEGLRAIRPNERPFVLTRASYAGGQRYSAAWTGDNESRWDNLEMALSMSLGMSISGQPFVGSDIGGFIGSPSGELFARWLELGVFTPLMRGHSVINSRNKEPWAFGPKFEAINRKTIDLRYTFLPYIYTAMAQASETGIPAMRPMVFEYPDDASFIWNADEFMIGDDVLVAPVLWPGETDRKVRLPKGQWYDYWTNTQYEGGSEVTVPAPLDRLPLFVKSGATLPTQDVVQYTDQRSIDPLTLTVYPGSSHSSQYYEDDGVSFDFEKGVYLRRTFLQSRSANHVTLTITKSEGTYQMGDRNIVVRFVGIPNAPSRVLVSGIVLPNTYWGYDSGSRTVTVKTKDSPAEKLIELVL